MTTLAVVGVGPKGLAIAAKRAALAGAGWQVPDLVLLDRAGAGVAATGRADGLHRRAAAAEHAPEKDVGFPYLPGWGPSSGEVGDRVRRWPWPGYLVAEGGVADWVDRGPPAPPMSSGTGTCAG